MAHDSGTGYISTNRKKQLHWFYSQTQVGTAYQQLNSGARALDVRPKLLANGTVVLQHGVVTIPTTVETMASDAVRWCQENDDELVLLLTNDLQYETTDDDDGNANDGYYRGTTALAAIYENLGVSYYSCDAVSGMTVAEVMEMAKLDGGGYLIALDRQDLYGSFCGKSNWVESQLVTCYPQDGQSTCINNKGGDEPLASLKAYILESVNNDATDDSGTLGPPADLEKYPFNEIQAMWQVDGHAAVAGLQHLSTLLEDNKRSHVNRELVDMIYHEADSFESPISLFAVDNVALNGLALLSILRTQCGQSTMEVCGRELPRPSMMHVNMSSIVYCSIVLLFLFVILRGIWRSHGHDMLLSVRSLFDGSVKDLNWTG